ncbi:unnamed protein product [Withania somnifera]
MGLLFRAMELRMLWRHVKMMVIVSLSRLGLYKPQGHPEEEEDADYNPNNYILLLEGSLVTTVPMEVASAAVKLKVPILLYRDYVLLRGNYEVKVCSICLESMELYHEIRHLITCTHVFHRGCLDSWVNHGHVTCPLCRSLLLPPKFISFRSSTISP